MWPSLHRPLLSRCSLTLILLAPVFGGGLLFYPVRNKPRRNVGAAATLNAGRISNGVYPQLVYPCRAFCYNMIEMPKGNRWKYIAAAVAVLLVAVVAAYWQFIYKRVPAPVYAPKGELVRGFPKELVLDQKGIVSGSYYVNYSTSLNQYTAVFDSTEPMLSLFSQYKDYLSKNGWTITNEITKYETSRGLYAVKGAADASVAIIEQAKSREVTVSFVQR